MEIPNSLSAFVLFVISVAKLLAIVVVDTAKLSSPVILLLISVVKSVLSDVVELPNVVICVCNVPVDMSKSFI